MSPVTQQTQPKRCPKQIGEKGYRFWWSRLVLDAGVSTGALALAHCLLAYLNDSGRCYPTRQTMLDDLGCSDRTLARWAQELEAAGLLHRTEAHAGQQTTWYALVPNPLPPRTAAAIAVQKADTGDSHSDDDDGKADTGDGQSTERLTLVSGKADTGDSPNPQEPPLTENPYPARARESATHSSSTPQSGRGGSTSSKATRRQAAKPAGVSEDEARNWLSSLVERMPPDARHLFLVEWPQLVEQDPTWETIAVDAARKLLAKNNPAAVAHVEKLVLTDSWDGLDSVARGFAGRFHSACKTARNWRTPKPPPAPEPAPQLALNVDSTDQRVDTLAIVANLARTMTSRYADLRPEPVA